MMNKSYGLLFALLLFTNLAKSQTTYFPPLTGNQWETLPPDTLNWCEEKIDSLYKLLETNQTKAFILLYNGKIVLEKYFDGHTATSPWQWASAGKGLTAVMAGIAQQEGKLNINNKVSDYLGKGWTNCTEAQEDKITIKHQLSMATGLNDAVADQYCTIDSCLTYKADAGTRWAYHNAPYTLLDTVIANATGMLLNTYTNLKLKIPTGISGGFFKIGFNNVYISNARSMARFGLLMLNKGNWNGNQILTDTNYFNQMTNTSQNYNLSYGYLWWLNGKQSFMIPQTQAVFNGWLNTSAPADAYFAMGKDGQFINIVPSKNMVWIRMGNAPDNALVPFLFNETIWQYINRLPCLTVGSKQNKTDMPGFKIYPNPARQVINIEWLPEHAIVQILDLAGNVLLSTKPLTNAVSLPVSNLQNGMYIIAVNANGKITYQRVVVGD